MFCSFEKIKLRLGPTFKKKKKKKKKGFIATVFVPAILEAVLEAARQKMYAVPKPNRSA